MAFSPKGSRVLFQSDCGCGHPSNPVLEPNAPVDTCVFELLASIG